MEQQIRALILSEYPEAGADPAEAALIRELFRRGVYLEVVTGQPSGTTRSFREAGITVHHGLHPTSRRDPMVRKEIRHLLIEGAFDILHLFNSRAIANGIQAARGLPVKVITYRGSGDLHWHDPTAYKTHLHPRVDAISCLSRYVQRQVDRQFLWRRKKTQVHYKGFLPHWFESIKPLPRDTFTIPEHALVVGCVANYRKVKGLEYLLKATRYLGNRENLYLLLIGRNTDHPRLQRLVHRSPMKNRIRRVGFREDIYSCIKMCDFYAQPSLKEGLGRSLIECMMLEVPVIATRAGAMPEVVKNGDTGLLVPRKNPKALAEAMKTMADHPEKRKKFATHAREYLLRYLSMDQYVEGVLSLYRKMKEEL